jgi:shikimate dehydrogenase
MNLGIIGKSLIHSFSPQYFAEKFIKEACTDNSYHAFEIPQLDKATLDALVINKNLNGFNVTIPYKETIIPLLNNLSDDAKTIGAVNTVEVNWINDKEYSLKGHNTDWIGFLKAIRPFLTVHHQKALILGTGGASKAVAYALSSLGIDYYFVSRSKDESHVNQLQYSDLNKNVLSFYKFIINTSPLGTYPEVEGYPEIPYEFIGKEHLLFDLVYNPAETVFLAIGKEKGASVMNGLSMLQFQADEAWQLWNNKKGHSV